MPLVLINGKFDDQDRNLDARSRDLAVDLMDDVRRKELALMHGIISRMDPGSAMIVEHVRFAEQLQNYKFIGLLKEHLDQDTLKNIGMDVFKEGNRIKRRIANQIDRKHPGFNPVHVEVEEKKREDDELFTNVSSFEVVKEPYYLAPDDFDGKISLLHGFTLHARSGGKEGKVLSGFIDITALENMSGNRIEEAGDGPLVRLPFEGSCIVTSDARFECGKPEGGLYNWSFLSVDFDSKAEVDMFMERMGFEFRGYNEKKNERVHHGLYSRFVTRGEACIEKDGEKCFLRWEHPGTGIRIASERREKKGMLSNLSASIPANSLEEWKPVRDALEGRSTAESPFSDVHYLSDELWLREERQ